MERKGGWLKMCGGSMEPWYYGDIDRKLVREGGTEREREREN